MIGLLQRVLHAKVEVAGKKISAIEKGLLVFVGIEKNDTSVEANRLLERLLCYRVFPDERGKMNKSLQDINGGLLLVPQFTLPADTNKGNRPSFSSAAAPQEGARLFEVVLKKAEKAYSNVAAGLFGADMQVSLTNDGPVTFWLQVPPLGNS